MNCECTFIDIKHIVAVVFQEEVEQCDVECASGWGSQCVEIVPVVWIFLRPSRGCYKLRLSCRYLQVTATIRIN